jgi:hypothetical protein
MARGSRELELGFIEKAKENTGHTVEEWMKIIEQANLDAKTNTILNHLKGNHGLNHLQSSFLTGIYLNGGKPVYDYEVLFAKLIEGKEKLLPVYNSLQEQVAQMFDDVVFVPTRAYVSIEGQKIFGCARFTAKTIRYGLDLGELPFEGRVQPAKGLGAMPNLTHMVELASADDIDDEVLALTRQAFNRVHG